MQTAKDNLEIVKEGITKNSASFSSTLIRSTITGLILDVPIKVGNSVIMSNTFNDGTTIATVANMNDLIFRGNLDETEVGRVHEGMPVKLTIGALQNLSFNAVLEYISPKGVEENGATNSKSKRPSRRRTAYKSVPAIPPMRKLCWNVPSRRSLCRKVRLSSVETAPLYMY